MPKSTFTIFVPEESVYCSFLRIFMKMFVSSVKKVRNLSTDDRHWYYVFSFSQRNDASTFEADAWLTCQNSLGIFVCECRLGSLFHDCPPPAICSKWAPECSYQRHAGRTKGWYQPTTKQLTFEAANRLVIRRMHSLYLNFCRLPRCTFSYPLLYRLFFPCPLPRILTFIISLFTSSWNALGLLLF